MPAIIETEKLTKSYGEHRGIIDIDLTVEKGEVFGFLGPNGAGKTTTIRTLLDLIRPTAGRATIFGIDTTVDPVAIHRRIGYIPGEFALYDRLTGGQTLEYFGNLRGGVDPAYRRGLVERFDIDDAAVAAVRLVELLEGDDGGHGVSFQSNQTWIAAGSIRVNAPSGRPRMRSMASS